MPVKRRPHEEIEDIPGTEEQTAPPRSLVLTEDYTPWSKMQTDVPSEQSDYDEDAVASEARLRLVRSQEPIGRTWPDLAFTFFNRPQFVPIISIFLASFIFSRQLQTIGDMWRPALLVGIINVVWFGGNWIIKLHKRGRGVEEKKQIVEK